MKKLIMLAICVMASVCAMAQTPETTISYKREGNTFVQTKTGSSLPYKGDVVTAYTWKDSKGNEYPIYLHTYTKGEKIGRTCAYVIRTSAKTGNQYPYWLPDGEKIAEEILKENL